MFSPLSFQPVQSELGKKTLDFETECYRRLLNISFQDHETNEEVRRKVQAAIGEYDELLTLVKKRKLKWFGHVSMCSGLAKTLLQSTVKGQRKRGRQKKRWEDNIKEWTGMDFASSTRAAENKRRGKGLLRTHLWYPDDLLRLWDRTEHAHRTPLFLLQMTLVIIPDRLKSCKVILLFEYVSSA